MFPPLTILIPDGFTCETSQEERKVLISFIKDPPKNHITRCLALLTSQGNEGCSEVLLTDWGSCSDELKTEILGFFKTHREVKDGLILYGGSDIVTANEIVRYLTQSDFGSIKMLARFEAKKIKKEIKVDRDKVIQYIRENPIFESQTLAIACALPRERVASFLSSFTKRQWLRKVEEKGVRTWHVIVPVESIS